jgi:hypothetical protein
VAGRAERRDVVGAEVLHFVEEDRDTTSGVGREPADIGEQFHQVDLDVTGVGASTRGRDVDAGTPLVFESRARARISLGEGPNHTEHLVDRVLIRVAEFAYGLMQRTAQRTAQPLVGAGFEFAGPPLAAYGSRAQRVEQHGLADTAQAGEDEGAFGASPRHPLQDDVERRELLVAAGELGRALARTGGVRVANRIHDVTVCRYLACFLDWRAQLMTPRRDFVTPRR